MTETMTMMMMITLAMISTTMILVTMVIMTITRQRLVTNIDTSDDNDNNVSYSNK